MKSKHNRTEEATEQGSGSTRPTASFRRNLDFLYNLNHIIITSRLTNQVAQFWELDQWASHFLVLCYLIALSLFDTREAGQQIL